MFHGIYTLSASRDSVPVSLTESICSTGDITGVVKVGCGRIEWEPATVAGCTDPGLTYKIRIFSGLDFLSSGSSQRRVLSSNTNFLTFTSAEIPSTRPLKAIVSGITLKIYNIMNGETLLIIVLMCEGFASWPVYS